MFYVFDYYSPWAEAANKPITTTCMTKQACIPKSFGKMLGNFSFNSQGVVIEDGDHFSFEKGPILTALAFHGFALGGKPFGITIMGMGRLDGAPLYMFSSTGFLGVVVQNPSAPWTPGSIHAGPRCADIVTQMHFAV